MKQKNIRIGGENSYNNVLVEDRNFYQMEVTNIWCSPSYTYLKLDTDTFGRGRGNIRQLLGKHLHCRVDFGFGGDTSPQLQHCFTYTHRWILVFPECALHIGGAGFLLVKASALTETDAAPFSWFCVFVIEGPLSRSVEILWHLIFKIIDLVWFGSR